MSEETTKDAGDRRGERSEVQRANELLEQWGEQLGRWLSRTASRAREEAEDIWAEAQSIHQGERR